MPLSTAFAPCCRAKSTSRPSKVLTETLPNSGDRLGDHLLALGNGKQRRALLGVAQNRHHEMVHNLGTSRDQIEVSVSQRIEGSGIDRLYSVHHIQSIRCLAL